MLSVGFYCNFGRAQRKCLVLLPLRWGGVDIVRQKVLMREYRRNELNKVRKFTFLISQLLRGGTFLKFAN